MQLLEEGERATCALAPAIGLSISIWIWPPGKKIVEFAGYLNLHPALGVDVAKYQSITDRPLHTWWFAGAQPLRHWPLGPCQAAARWLPQIAQHQVMLER
jgi:hypothetical protein